MCETIVNLFTFTFQKENIKIIGKENRKRKNTDAKQSKEEANLVPVSGKKMQKLMVKKMRKETRRGLYANYANRYACYDLTIQ